MDDPVPSSTTSFLDCCYYDQFHNDDNNTLVTGGLEDYSVEGEKNCSSLGFMELPKTQQGFGLDVPTTSVDPQIQLPQASKVQQTQESPATPNYSSSISSESIGGLHDEDTAKVVADGGGADEPQKKAKQQLKPKKIKQKKKQQQREPRFAFMTKSDIDHLEDGYRWRKYGQKAVKNSSYPRSYFRCTNASCSVKKRVERCYDDLSIVVTTYEGQHTHPCPMIARSTSPAAATLPPIAAPLSLPLAQTLLLPSDHQAHHLSFSCYSKDSGHRSSAIDAAVSSAGPAAHHHLQQFGDLLLTDQGLLEDMLPWSTNIVKREE